MNCNLLSGARLRSGVSVMAMAMVLVGVQAARAQTATGGDIGAVDIDAARQARPQQNAPAASGPATGQAAIASDAAIGSGAPIGSAPALSVSQQSLNATEPASIVSDKVLRDVIIPSSDYNESGKYTPNFVSNNPNGPLGDSKSSWRGFQDGQFNITFDGIPFGDANDPTHHSAAYFPAAFLSKVVIDRGPGPASQPGYATFGGTMALYSFPLSDHFGGNIETSFGAFNTLQTALTVQTGYNKDFQTRALFQYEHAQTNGQLDYGHVNQNNFLGKIEKQIGEVTATFFGTYGTEQYNNTSAITWPQWMMYGKNYGALNANPKSVLYYGYNNSEKQTDMEYIDLRANLYGFDIDNKVYTYSYWYPSYQNNGINSTIEGNASVANGGTITSVKIPNANGTSSKVNLLGVSNGDVIGYLKFNNYRAWGDLLAIKRKLDLGNFSGELRFGVWIERVGNERLQEYFNYTKGMSFVQLGNGLKSSYKLNLSSYFNNFQPYIEYEWKVTDKLSVTPGYKYESFTRDHQALVNQTTLAPLYYSHEYTTNLPFFTVRYRATDAMTFYGQASQGFLAPTVSAYYVFDPSQNNIQPQQTTNYQVGAIYKTRDFTGDIALYSQRATNFPIVTNLTNGLQIYQNGGTAQYQGIELEGTWGFGRQYGLDGLGVTGSWGLSNARFVQGQFSGLAVGDAPLYTLAGGLIYDDGALFGSLLQKFVGAGYGSNGQKAETTTTNANLNHISPYNSTDAAIGYRYKLPTGFAYGYGKQIEFRLGVQNIFDHRSITEINGDPTGIVSINNTALTYQFQGGRYVYGAVNYSF